jgi:hypothetical protein
LPASAPRPTRKASHDHKIDDETIVLLDESALHCDAESPECLLHLVDLVPRCEVSRKRTLSRTERKRSGKAPRTKRVTSTEEPVALCLLQRDGLTTFEPLGGDSPESKVDEIL